jgi:hypothetical protein
MTTENAFYDLLVNSDDPAGAYRALAKKHHPDLGGDAEDFKRLANAWERALENNGKHEAEAKKAGTYSGPVDFPTHGKTSAYWYGRWVQVPRFINYLTGKDYTMGNIWRLLADRPHEKDDFFATFKQWTGAGCKVKKGCHGVRLQFFSMAQVEDKTTGKLKTLRILKSFTVFGASLIEWDSIPEDLQKHIGYLQPALEHTAA